MKMSTIELPILVSYPEQVGYVVSILNKYVPKHYKKGIQVYRGSVNRDKQVSNREIETTIKNNVPKNFVINLHAPFIVTGPKPEYNFTSDKVENMMLENISLAESINADSLIIHLNSTFYHPNRLADSSNSKENFELFRWKNRWNDYKTVKEEVIDPAYDLLKNISRKTRTKISVENLLIPIGGDSTKNPRNLLYDPKLNTYESIIDFLDNFSSFKNVGFCFDTAHYEITQNTINNLIKKYGKRITQEDIMKEGFIGLYPEKFSLQPNLKDVIKELISKNALFDLQIANSNGGWVKDLKLIEEGSPMTDDASRTKYFEVLEYVIKNSSNTTISFDIEEKDYMNRINQINSLKLFFEYLSSKGL